MVSVICSYNNNVYTYSKIMARAVFVLSTIRVSVGPPVCFHSFGPRVSAVAARFPHSTNTLESFLLSSSYYFTCLVWRAHTLLTITIRLQGHIPQHRGSTYVPTYLCLRVYIRIVYMHTYVQPLPCTWLLPRIG